MSRRNHWIASVLLTALPLAALAWTPPDPQVVALQEQIAALQTDHALNLSQQQAQALLPVLQSARAQLQAADAQRQAARPALVTALTQAVSDLKSTGAISASTAQAVNAARPQRGTEPAGLSSTWEQVQQLLTAEQRQALANLRLGVPGAEDRPPHPEPRAGAHLPFREMHVVLSDAFQALVQARAG